LISQKIRLLELPASVQTQIEGGELTTAHGVALAKLGNAKHQERMAKRALDFGWTAKRLETTIDKFVKKGKRPAKERIEFPEGDIPGVYFKDAKDMSELPDKSVHLIVTSPPYCVGMEFEKGISYAEHWENMQEVMAEAGRVLVPGGIMAINVGDIHNFKGAKGNNKYTQIQLVGHKYQSFLRKHQAYLTDLIVWVKRTHAHSPDISKVLTAKTLHTGYRMLISHDPVYIFRKKGERDTPSEDIVLSSRITKEEWSQWASGIWTINRVSQKEGHPAVFPDELVARLVRMFSYEGDMVLDPFLGSGTTVKVARELNREAIGYERERQYKAVIANKLGVDLGDESRSMIEYAGQSMRAEASEKADTGEVSEAAFESGPAC
jgi:DNA modification methylase